MDDNSVEVRSVDVASTREYARILAEFLQPGAALCLDGELGAGKTCFVDGLADALGAPEGANSPTFALENRYPLKREGIPELLHMDLYRSGDQVGEDLIGSALEARAAASIVAVEWPQAIAAHLVPYLSISFALSGDARTIRLSPIPAGWRPFETLLERWRQHEALST